MSEILHYCDVCRTMHAKPRCVPVEPAPASCSESPFNGAQDAINRMARAYRNGTGCHLTAEMVQSLGLTIVGEMMSEPDPRSTQNSSIERI